MRLVGAEPNPLRRWIAWLIALGMLAGVVALRRALDLVFEAYKDPSDGKLRALSDAFSPDALSFERTEAEHLLSGALHLTGSTPYVMDVLSNTPKSADESEIATHEIWTYDEVDAQNRSTRCVREE